jgi:beta-1,4-N-acetylglucosaminyltransferase
MASLLALHIYDILLVLLLRFLFVYRKTKYNRRTALRNNQLNRSQPVASAPKATKGDNDVRPPLRTLIVLGSGGHTTEILYMTQHLNMNGTGPLFHPIDYCKADTDTTSTDRVRLNHAFTNPNSSDSIQIHNIPRSREVGQSYISSIYSTLVSIWYSFLLVYRLRPRVILCNGPGTCIPICFVVLLYRALNLLPNHQTYIVFIESFCRVETLSMTGKILYPIVDVFLVHWDELQQKYPNSILTHSFLPPPRLSEAKANVKRKTK